LIACWWEEIPTHFEVIETLCVDCDVRVEGKKEVSIFFDTWRLSSNLNSGRDKTFQP
jgi:hypothetical protein